jgi:hypothetical protein
MSETGHAHLCELETPLQGVPFKGKNVVHRAHAKVVEDSEVIEDKFHFGRICDSTETQSAQARQPVQTVPVTFPFQGLSKPAAITDGQHMSNARLQLARTSPFTGQPDRVEGNGWGKVFQLQGSTGKSLRQGVESSFDEEVALWRRGQPALIFSVMRPRAYRRFRLR